MISLKTIAEECGVSVATVSKALNDQKDISDVTKRRIREIAEKLGYFPNAAARSLKTKQSYNIGVLFEEEVGSGLTHEYFSGVLNSFKVQAEKLGYDITFINTSLENRKMSYYEHCMYRNFAGVAIVCANFDDSEVIDLMNSKLPGLFRLLGWVWGAVLVISAVSATFCEASGIMVEAQHHKLTTTY